MASGVVRGSEFVHLYNTTTTGTIANNANWYKAVSDMVAVPSGYKIVSITPMITGSYSTYVDIHIVGLNNNLNNPAVVLINRSGSALSFTVAVHVVAEKA